MSEQLIQKLLDIGGCDAETEWAKGYDDGLNVAIDIVEKYFEQPTLNENQQIVLEWLKGKYNSPIMINPIAVVFSLHDELVKDSEIDAVEAYEELGLEEEIQVLKVFSQWVLEQEAE